MGVFQNHEILLVVMLYLTVIIPCGIEYESLWRPREGTRKENDPGDVPNSVALFGGNFETPFSRTVGQADLRYGTHYFNV